MPGLKRLAGETRRDNRNAVVPAPACRAGVADVLCGLVFYRDRFRGERAVQLLANQVGNVQALSFLSCTYFESSTACNPTNTSMSPIPPKSLKFTQACSENV